MPSAAVVNFLALLYLSDVDRKTWTLAIRSPLRAIIKSLNQKDHWFITGPLAVLYRLKLATCTPMLPVCAVIRRAGTKCSNFLFITFYHRKSKGYMKCNFYTETEYNTF